MKPRSWSLSRFADGHVCRSIGPDESSSAVERIDVVEESALLAAESALEAALDLLERFRTDELNPFGTDEALLDDACAVLRKHGRLAPYSIETEDAR
jgi:hypothetical protein